MLCRSKLTSSIFTIVAAPALPRDSYLLWAILTRLNKVTPQSLHKNRGEMRTAQVAALSSPSSWNSPRTDIFLHSSSARVLALILVQGTLRFWMRKMTVKLVQTSGLLPMQACWDLVCSSWGVAQGRGREWLVNNCVGIARWKTYTAECTGWKQWSAQLS